MLLIKAYKDKDWQEWHVGDGPLPFVVGAGMEIHADGHELVWLMDCIRAGTVAATKNYYRDVHHTVWEPEDGSYGF